MFGPYPFSSVGAIVDVTNAGYQMETQTRPEFTSANGLSALAHELAHQWYGDNVAARSMRDVWLSEGFATFANWLYTEHNGGTTAQAVVQHPVRARVEQRRSGTTRSSTRASPTSTRTRRSTRAAA